MEGKPDMIGAVPTNVPPAQAFQTVDVLQQAIERTERYSPYASGVPNSAVDKTAGTASGIQSMQQAAEPNFQIKLDALEESYAQPVARTELKMIANLMSPTDFRYGMLQGKTSEWVKAGKNILMGKPKASDLLAIGYTTPETVLEMTHTMEPSGEIGPDGQPLMDIVPIPGADKAVVFDIDWLVEVRLDNQAEAKKDKETNDLMAWAKFSQELGVQLSPDRLAIYVGQKKGIEDVENLMMTEEEKKAQQQQMMMAQQQEQQVAQGQQKQQTQAQTEQIQVKAQTDKEMLQAKMQHEKELAMMK